MLVDARLEVRNRQSLVHQDLYPSVPQMDPKATSLYKPAAMHHSDFATPFYLPPPTVRDQHHCPQERPGQC